MRPTAVMVKRKKSVDKNQEKSTFRLGKFSGFLSLLDGQFNIYLPSHRFSLGIPKVRKESGLLNTGKEKKVVVHLRNIVQRVTLKPLPYKLS